LSDALAVTLLAAGTELIAERGETPGVTLLEYAKSGPISIEQFNAENYE
jgi:hypothetical protein